MNKKNYKVGEIRGILEEIYNDPIERRTKVPIFMSNPGMGKTYIIEQFMKDKGVYKPPFILGQRMPFELTGMAIPDHSTKKMSYYDFDFLLTLKDGDILFIDEALNTIPQTINALLTFLESRVMISGKKMPDIMIVAAANPQGMPVLTPQIKRRFVFYDIKFDQESWVNFMYSKYAIKKESVFKNILNNLSNLIKAEDFQGYNFDTSADIDKAVYSLTMGHKTPYSNILEPILNAKMKNPLDGDITLPDNTILEEGDYIEWLKLKRLINGIIKKH